MIKSYTDIEQSKKLAEILPIESADMKWFFWKEDIDKPKIPTFGYSKTAAEDYKNTKAVYLPAWSFAALFDVLSILDNRSPVISKTFDRKYRVVYHSTTYEKAILTTDYDNPVDACYEMIIKLHELNLL